MLSLWKLRKLEGYVKEATEFGRNKSIQGSRTSFPRSLFENEKGEDGIPTMRVPKKNIQIKTYLFQTVIIDILGI